MKLGLANDEVAIVPYTSQWKGEFIKVKAALIENSNLQPYQIEHIGSTSIKGIQAKPIIDILVGVDNLTFLEKSFFKELLQVGFYRLRVERPNEIVCAKFTDESFESKTHFIHIVEWNGLKWRQLLFFRDYLNANKDVKLEYETLKNAFFNTDLKGIMAYTNYKEAFVQAIVSKMEDA